MCRPCHVQQHAWGIRTWQERKGVDLEAELERMRAMVAGG